MFSRSSMCALPARRHPRTTDAAGGHEVSTATLMSAFHLATLAPTPASGARRAKNASDLGCQARAQLGQAHESRRVLPTPTPLDELRAEGTLQLAHERRVRQALVGLGEHWHVLVEVEDHAAS